MVRRLNFSVSLYNVRMVPLSRPALITCAFVCACSVSAQSWTTESAATGWDLNAGTPVTNVNSQTFSSVAEYAAALYVLESDALADVHNQAAPTSRAHAYTRLDQSDPTNGTLRQLSESRAIYFGSVTHPVSSGSSVDIRYGIQVENTTGTALNLVFSNHIRGVLVQDYEGFANISERTEIEGFATFVGSAGARANATYVSSGGWENAVFSQTYQDPYLGSIPGFRLNSLQVYGTRPFAAGESDTINVHHIFNVDSGLLPTGFQNGIGVADFTGTADLTIRAYDSLGNDRTSEINITIVPEPATMIGLGIGVAMVARRRRNSR